MMDKPGIVVATCRPDSYAEWIEAWAEEFKEHNAQIFIMHDSQNGEGGGPEIQRATGEFFGTDHQNYLNHAVAELQLGPRKWIIPSKTSACKSFGIYKAWLADCDPIIVLDDDCLPGVGLIEKHIERLNLHTRPWVFWTMAERPRGVPYLGACPIMLNHGLWSLTPDLDAMTWLQYYEIPIIGLESTYFNLDCLPFGAAFPMSGMNIAFRNEIVPLMYFGLQGPDWGVDRFDDIWAGFIVKKILDYFEKGISTGNPVVKHAKASNVFESIAKEAPGYKMNCDFYRFIMQLNLYGAFLTKYTDAMYYVADKMIDWGSEINIDYWQRYGEAIHIWTSLFEGEKNEQER